MVGTLQSNLVHTEGVVVIVW